MNGLAGEMRDECPAAVWVRPMSEAVVGEPLGRTESSVTAHS